MRLNPQHRAAIEARITAAADRLLAGDIPAHGHADVTTLAALAGVSRASLYRTHRHLKDDFERRLHQRQATGHIPDPRDARLAAIKQRLTQQTAQLREREDTIAALRDDQRRARCRLLAQHDEITALRTELARRTNVHALRPSTQRQTGESQ